MRVFPVSVRVLMCRVGEPTRCEWIENDLRTLQAIVGGHLESWVVLGDLHLICHDEGALIGLPPNRIVRGLGVIHGTFIVARVDAAGDLAPVGTDDIDRFLEISQWLIRLEGE